MQRSIKYKGVIIWNNIPSDVRKNTFQKIKSNYKDQLQCCSYFRDTPAKIGMFDVCRQFFATHVG